MGRGLLCVFTLSLFVSRLQATEYLIEFDTLSGHTPGTGATLSPDVLNAYGWRSIGDPNGGRFINRTGKTIRAIHLKTNGGANTFKITSNSGGRLFDTVWVKNDGTESLFLDGNIPNVVGSFWMRVPRNTQDEIQQCDTNNMCPFEGQVFEQNPAEPSGDWTKVHDAPHPPDSRWRDLLAATPSDFRDIQTYGESADGRQILFISNGSLLLFQRETKSVSAVPVLNATLPRVNRISMEDGQFKLLQNGAVVQSVDLSTNTKTRPEEIGKAQ